jgi:hypothetical protein
LGTRQPAEQGQLIVLAAGPRSVRDTAMPVLDAIGIRTVWVSERPGDGHRLKLVANAWVLTVTAGVAQSIGLATDLGLDPRQFLDVIGGGPLDCAYAQVKGASMIEDDFAPAFTLEGAVKDSELILAAMHTATTDDTLIQALRRMFRMAAEAGHGHEDMSAVITAFRDTTEHGRSFGPQWIRQRQVAVGGRSSAGRDAVVQVPQQIGQTARCPAVVTRAGPHISRTERTTQCSSADGRVCADGRLSVVT